MFHFHFLTGPLKNLPIKNDPGKMAKFKGTMGNSLLLKGTMGNSPLLKVTEVRDSQMKATCDTSLSQGSGGRMNSSPRYVDILYLEIKDIP